MTPLEHIKAMDPADQSLAIGILLAPQVMALWEAANQAIEEADSEEFGHLIQLPMGFERVVEELNAKAAEVLE